eukprot:CAMPEP_0172816890 /NCGR_PEP_ID=MMETSP1075-20121228/12797_1 /TAXON_ID=2916 /ORGANISM="Ceratium fusus, Strain PA161109" /LENGTH=223 /DNA_ID=CAMNT_0013656971 /DNA_START=9 /DNA_END=677 /DNA_ORIENTATION=+
MFAFLAAMVLAEGRLLAPPGKTDKAATASPVDADDQIADLSAQIAAAEGQVQMAAKDAGVPADDDDKPAWEPHCKPETKAELEKAYAEMKHPTGAKAHEHALPEGFAERMEATTRKSMVDNEEFVLGLLMMHQTRGNWEQEQYLDAICALNSGNPMLIRLYKEHDTKQPLAFQLAKLMDDERKAMAPTRAPPLDLDGGVKGLLAAAGAELAPKDEAQNDPQTT